MDYCWLRCRRGDSVWFHLANVASLCCPTDGMAYCVHDACIVFCIDVVFVFESWCYWPKRFCLHRWGGLKHECICYSQRKLHTSLDLCRICNDTNICCCSDSHHCHEKENQHCNWHHSRSLKSCSEDENFVDISTDHNHFIDCFDYLVVDNYNVLDVSRLLAFTKPGYGDADNSTVPANTTAPRKCHFKQSIGFKRRKYLNYLMIYHFFGLLWTNQFNQSFGIMCVSGAVGFVVLRWST